MLAAVAVQHIASQVHGRIIHATTADHIDVVGHLHEPGHPAHHDWIASGAGRRRFEALWRDVATAIIAD